MRPKADAQIQATNLEVCIGCLPPCRSEQGSKRTRIAMQLPRAASTP